MLDSRRLARGYGFGSHALMWQWSGGGGTFNGHDDFDQTDANLTP